MRRSWLRRKRRLWVVSALVLAAIWAALTAFMFVLTPTEARELAVWVSGVIAGCALMMFVAVRETPPGSIERWQEGAYGESATAKELEKLPSGWEVLHDLRNGDYNFDHVVIGPPGVFLLNSKWSSFHLQTVNGGLVGVHPDDGSVTMALSRVVSQAKRDAVDLKKTIEARAGQRLWVNPVIVWWGRYDDGGRTVDGVAFVRGDELVKRIVALPGKRRTDLGDVVAVLRPGRHRHAR